MTATPGMPRCAGRSVVTVVLRRVLVPAGTAVAMLLIAVPAWAAPAQTPALKPRAGEWWFTTWKILPKVWPLTQGAGVTVAVLDSGVQANVPDLRGAVVPGGDVTGNHTNGEQDFNTVGDGHGTSMAVLIAGQGHGTGMVGIAPKAKILPVAVNSSSVDMTSDPDRVAAGIIYATNHGAKVIDISQVYPAPSASACDSAEQAAVAYAISRDVVVIAAEGSSNLIGARPSEPASCAGVMSVGAIEPTKAVWPQDVREPYLTVVSPGADLISSGRDGQLVTNVSGARAASALIAGAAALIRSRYPTMPWYQVIERMVGTALPEGGTVPNESYGYGIVRLSEVANATAFPVGASAPNPVYAKYLAWLATKQGRADERQIAGAAAGTASAKAAPATGRSGRVSSATAAAKRMSRIMMISVAVMVMLAVLVVAALFAAAGNRRPRRARRQAPSPPVPSHGWEEPVQGQTGSRIIFGEDRALPDLPPYRVPPYSPIPEPRSSARHSGPIALDRESRFPDGGTRPS